MKKLKFLALFALVSAVAGMIAKRLLSNDDIWQAATDTVTPSAPAKEPAAPAAEQSVPETEEEIEIARGVAEGLPAEDPFAPDGAEESEVAAAPAAANDAVERPFDPLTDPLTKC